MAGKGFASISSTMVTHYNALHGRVLGVSSICATTMQVHGITCHLITPTGHEKDVTAENISKHLKLTAGLLNYPKCKGILGERVDTHSLRRGGANAITLSGY